jgi:hypothetical protein
VIYGQRAAIALGRGSLHDAQVDAETGLLLVEDRHFANLQLLAVAISVHVERGDVGAADELAQRREALGVAEDRAYLEDFLVARRRLRIAQGRIEEGVADLTWCGERLERPRSAGAELLAGVRGPALASLGETATAAALAQEQLGLARAAGATGAVGRSLRATALVARDDRRIAVLEEAVSVLEQSADRLELAHALCDLGAALSRGRQRRQARGVQRRAMELAGACGAIALAARGRSCRPDRGVARGSS